MRDLAGYLGITAVGFVFIGLGVYLERAMERHARAHAQRTANDVVDRVAAHLEQAYGVPAPVKPRPKLRILPGGKE